jgi:hypothetical protein
MNSLSKGLKSYLNRFFNRQNFEQKQVVQKYQIEEFWNCRFCRIIYDLFLLCSRLRKLALNYIAKANKFYCLFEKSNSLKLFARKNLRELICAAKKQDQICSRMNC